MGHQGALCGGEVNGEITMSHFRGDFEKITSSREEGTIEKKHENKIHSAFSPFSLTNMDNDTVALALDRLKFYARDAFVTLSQVSRITEVCSYYPVYL